MRLLRLAAYAVSALVLTGVAIQALATRGPKTKSTPVMRTAASAKSRSAAARRTRRSAKAKSAGAPAAAKGDSHSASTMHARVSGNTIRSQ